MPNPKVLAVKAAAVYRATRNMAILRRQGKNISAHFEWWALQNLLASLDGLGQLVNHDQSGQTVLTLPKYVPVWSSEYTPTDSATITLSFDEFPLYS